MQTILVTGAANGLGKSIVQAFHDQGFHVSAIDKEPSIHDLQNRLPRVRTFKGDVTCEEDLIAVRDDLYEEGLEVRIVINCAGMFRFMPLTDCDFESLTKLFTLNALAPFLVIKTFLEDLRRTGGRVIQISSENSKLSGLFQPYPSSKIALESLSEAARQELKLLGVSLVVIKPGAIDTELLNWKLPESGVYNKYIDRFFKQARGRMSKISPPDKVAALVVKAGLERNPDRFYGINHNSWLSLFARLPVAIRESIVHRMMTN